MLRRVLALLIAPFCAARVLVSSPSRVGYRVLPVDEIGPLVLEPHHYLWSLKNNVANRRVQWIVKPGTFVCNHLVLDKWRSHIQVKESWIAWYSFRLVSLIVGTKYYVDVDRYQYSFDPRRERCYLTLTSEESSELNTVLSELGIELHRPIVAFTIRDETYKLHFGRRAGISDSKETYRNQDIESYELAATQVVAAGHQVVRMGVRVTDKFLSDQAGVIDYATSGRRSEVVDLGLASITELCVTSSLGFDQVFSTFGKRKCAIGLFHYSSAQLFYPWDVLSFRRLRETGSARELTLAESLRVPRIRDFRGDIDLAVSGLELVPPSHSEIAAYVLEALGSEPRYDELSDAEKEVQAQFWSILQEALPSVRPLPIEQRPRISLQFARTYDWWFR